MKRLHVRLARAARLAAPAAFVLSTVLLPTAASAANPGTPPRPKGSAAEAVTASEAKALADWTLAQPQVAARLKNHRTRLLKAGLSDTAKDGKSAAKAVLAFRDYDAGVVQQVVVDLESGAVEMGEVLPLVQPNEEEIAEGMAIVIRDPRLASFVADSSLTLMGGFHIRSPYADDPCSREVCLEFAFMKPGPSWNQPPKAQKVPPRRVIVNLSRGTVANPDYRTGDQSTPAARMTEKTEER